MIYDTPRRFRIVCGALAVACLGVGGTGTYLASQWNKATAVDLDEVLSDFRDAAPPESTSTTVAPVVESTVVTTMPAASSPTSAVTKATTTTAAPTGPAPYVRPAEGVYTYATKGNETVSVGGARHDYPSQVFAVVRHTACGYRIEVRVLEEHVDSTEVCLEGTQLLLKSFNQRMTFFGQTGEGAFACAPAAVLLDRAAGVGSKHPMPCTAASLQSNGTATYLRDEPVGIDGSQVTGQVAEWKWTATGAATGSGSARWTFDETGLPLRMERENSTQSSSVLGPATHTESASFVLQSRTPKR